MLAWFLGSRVGRGLLAIAAAAAAVGTIVTSIWVAAHRSAAKDAKIAGLRDYRDSRREMDNADISVGNAADDDAWLRRRANSKRGL